MAAVEAGQPKSAVARLLGVGRAPVDRSVRQQRAPGARRPKPLPGARPLSGPDQHVTLVAQLAAAPDATLAEHCATWEQAEGERVSSDTRRRAIARGKWRRTKRRSRPASRTPARGRPG